MVLNNFCKQIAASSFNLAAIFSFLFFTGCTPDSNPLVNNYNTEGKSALIIVVENNDGLLYSNLEFAFQAYKPQMLSIFSELFGVGVNEMNDMSLNEIFEKYGEPWQINRIKEFAEGHYDTIITMRNEHATSTNLKNNLIFLNNFDYTIDMVFCLHGSENIVSFYEHEYMQIQEFASYIKSNQIKLRMLYQTCCSAGKAIKKWESSDIYGVNGAEGVNKITLFSPGFFMEEWVKGAAFEDAVNTAFQRDIDKIGTYSDRIPVNQYILTNDNIENSKQKIGGRNKKIRISNYIKTDAGI